MADASTLVFDAKDKVLGRLASHVASELLTARKAGGQKRVIIVNAERAIVTGAKTAVFSKYDHKYKLNHPRKGPFFPRMPDMILKRTVRGMLPHKTAKGQAALERIKVFEGIPAPYDKVSPRPQARHCLRCRRQGWG